MNIVEALGWRGLIQDVSDQEGLKLLKPGDAFYVGYDPTAPSLTVGNLLPILVSIRLAKLGLKALQLFGGSTGAIGDPSGKSAERPLLDQATLEANIRSQSAQVQSIFERAQAKMEAVNNADWTVGLSVLEYLRDVGKHFTVNYMIAKEVVKARLEGEGISYTEFSYMLLQAYDFLHLYKTKNCKLQIGGSDQWGNMTAGLELIRKKAQGQAFALSFPLVTDSQGKKFGKSEGGALWLDAAKTSPYKFHQFWLNADDRDCIRYLKIFTFLSEAEIGELEKSLGSEPEKRLAQKTLADHVCNLVHGDAATQEARACAEVLFGGSLEGITEMRLLEIFSEAPSSSMTRSKLKALSSVEAFVETGLVKSKGEAKRLITQGGAYLNNERVSDPELKLDLAATKANILLLRSGKKNYHLVKIT